LIVKQKEPEPSSLIFTSSTISKQETQVIAINAIKTRALTLGKYFLIY
jgi:hypothetical protein